MGTVKKLLLILLPITCLANDPNLIMREGGIVRSDAIVLAYDFETGVADDLSPQGNDGTIANGVTHVPATATTSGSYDFDGINDYISVGTDNSLNLVDALTISIWIKPIPPLPVSASRLVERRNVGIGYEIYIYQTSGDLAMIIAAGERAKVTSSGLLDGDWHMVTYTYNGDLVTAYIDGVERANEASVTMSSNVSDTFFVGDRGAHDREYEGLLDELIVWSVALTPTEVAEQYNRSFIRHPN